MATASLRRSDHLKPEVCFCENKHRLMQDFMTAVQELLDLQSRQTAAVIDGYPDFSRFDLPIHIASQRKDQAKYVFLAHVEAHGCWSR
jgi:hypothetical protein